MRIEADTLQDAMIKAASELNCSVVDLDINVIQAPSAGILGFFKKTAIIEANLPKANPNKKPKERKPREKKERNLKSENSKGEISSNPAAEKAQKPQNSENAPKERRERKPKKQKPRVEFDKIIPEVKADLKELFEKSCFKIDSFEVEKFDNETLFIKVDGEDAALIIGKDGCRYKAFSYFLFNWINLKYGLNVRFEVSEFLKNQETMVRKYLEDIITRVNKDGKAITKPLDGVLIKIALEQLRGAFPNKYVGVKNGKNGKFIVINDFK